MAWAPIRRFLLRLLNLVARRRAERELSREVSAHLALLEDDLVVKGLTAPQARAAALQALDIARTKERHREVRSFAIIEHAWRDVRDAVRALAARPGFTAAAVVTIALGIGASIAMFSVAYGAALRPLPYPDPDRLIRLYEANPSQGRFKQEVSEPAFFAWRRSMSSLEAVAMYSKPSIRFLNREDPPAVAIMGVSPEFFEVLRVSPWIGGGFTPDAYKTRADDVILSVRRLAAFVRRPAGRRRNKRRVRRNRRRRRVHDRRRDA